MTRLTPALKAALAAAALILVLQALPAAALLEYRRAALAHEPWRLLGAHLVHLNWTHALVNACAWVVLARLFEPVIGVRRQWLCTLISAAAISIALAALFPSIAWYRGASGVLHALYFAGATMAWRTAARSSRRRPALLWATALLVVGWIKVALEWPGTGATPFAAWLGSTVVPQAHLIGALTGTGCAVLFSRRR